MKRTLLHPEARALLELRAAAGGLPVEFLSVPAARAAVAALPALQGPAEPMDSVEDRWISGPVADIHVRIYRPHRLRADAPLIVHLHGGGWVLGSLDIADKPCRSLAALTGAMLVSIEYRLAPEHRYPAAFEDARAAFRWCATPAAGLGTERRRLVLLGDSAGGNLAAALCLAERDAGGPPIAAQILVYPVLDFDSTRPSYAEHSEGYMLGRASMQWFWAHYLGGRAAEDAPDALPLRAASHAGLPPTFIGVAGFDPLRDEGLAYADALAGAGVPVILKDYADQMHAFMWTLGYTPSAARLLGDIAQALSSWGIVAGG